MVYTADWGLITNALQLSNIAGASWVVPLIIVFLIMLIITRDVEKWKIMAFPIMAGLKVVGIPRDYPMVWLLFIMLAGIIFVMESMAHQVLGKVLRPAYEKVQEIATGRKRLKTNVEEEWQNPKAREILWAEAKEKDIVGLNKYLKLVGLK